MGTGQTEFRSLVELLRMRAEEQADQTAFSFLLDGDEQEARLSYAGLDRQARAIAVRLLQAVDPDDRALLLYPPGLEFVAAFFGCQYARVLAVPTYPPQPGQTLERVRVAVEEARPRVVLTVAATRPYFEQRCKEIPALAEIPWIDTDDLAGDLADSWRPARVGPDTLAFLQFTSGSTGSPKGVMVSHGNLLHNQLLILAGMQLPRDWYGVSWLPLYHDMGLCGQLMIALYTGRHTTFLSPVDFLKRPVRWLRAISRQPGFTMSGAPNFAYEMCVRRVTPEQAEELDLSRWKVAYNGAEVVRADTLDRFSEAFAASGFRREYLYPTYGMAEATLIISGGDPAAAPLVRSVDAGDLARGRVRRAPTGSDGAKQLVASGHPLVDTRVAIVDPDTRLPCAEGGIGEVWLANRSVAHGYWEKEAETAETFQARLPDGEGPFLRTGDLGFLDDGELWITGRLKDLIIVLGRNHYPEDVESTVQACHASLRPGCGAAFGVEIDGEERVVVVQEVDETRLGELRLADLATAVRRAVARHHQVHLHDLALIRPRTLPKTSSGKLRRRDTRALFLAGGLDFVGGTGRDGDRT